MVYKEMKKDSKNKSSTVENRLWISLLNIFGTIKSKNNYSQYTQRLINHHKKIAINCRKKNLKKGVKIK